MLVFIGVMAAVAAVGSYLTERLDRPRRRLARLQHIGGLLHETYKVRLKHRERMATALNAQAAEKAAQYAAHTERLEQRVRVLERVITDRGITVAGEIEALRDAPLN